MPTDNIFKRIGSTISTKIDATKAELQGNIDALVKTDNNYTNAEKSKLAGIEDLANNYVLPAASNTVLGGVKVDDATTQITSGFLNVKNIEWTKIQSTPVTLSGYGITDGVSTSQKGAINGVASLDGSGKVPATQLPSYVDDVLEYANQGSFPALGEGGKIYIDTATNKSYRWSGSSYFEIVGSQITANSHVIKFDTGSSEGTDLYTFNGSVSKTVDIKAGTNITLTKAAGSITINSTGGSSSSVSYNIGNSTGSVTVTMSNGEVQYATSTGVTTWTFAGAAAAPNVTEFTLELTNGGAFAQNWPSSVKWDGGTAPTLTTSGLDILTFYTRDGGIIWRGFLAAKDSK